MSLWRCTETCSARSHDFRWESAPTPHEKPSCSAPVNLSVTRLLGRQVPETPGFLACGYPMPGFLRRQMPWNAYGPSGDRFDGRRNRRAARRKAATCYCRFNTAMYTRIPAAKPRSSQLFTGSATPKRVKLGRAMTGLRENTRRSRRGDGRPVVDGSTLRGPAWWGRPTPLARMVGQANAAGGAWRGGGGLMVRRGCRGGRRASGDGQLAALTCSQEAAYIYMQPNGCM
jgi:hypothetical protein